MWQSAIPRLFFCLVLEWTTSPHTLESPFSPAEEFTRCEEKKVQTNSFFYRRLVKVLPRTAKWSVSDWRLLARHFTPPFVDETAACRQSAGADLDFVVVLFGADETASSAAVVSSGEEGGVGNAGKASPPPVRASKAAAPAAVGELGSEETERRAGEQGRATGAEEEEEEEVEASESVKEVFIPSIEWKDRLKRREPTARGETINNRNQRGLLYCTQRLSH